MTGVMMTYKPSPKPNFHAPTHIDYKKMETFQTNSVFNTKNYYQFKTLHQNFSNY